MNFTVPEGTVLMKEKVNKCLGICVPCENVLRAMLGCLHY